jgi:hypothetical protein
LQSIRRSTCWLRQAWHSSRAPPASVRAALCGPQTTHSLLDLGKAGKIAGGIVKGVGVAATVVNGAIATAQLINEPTVDNAARVAVQGIAIGASFIPVVGWGVSLGIGIADAIWGEDFYQWLDKK